jgi:hypothetical protein
MPGESLRRDMKAGKLRVLQGHVLPLRPIPWCPICVHLRDLWFSFRSPRSLFRVLRRWAFFSLVVGVVIDRHMPPRVVPASHGAECHRNLPRLRFQAQNAPYIYKSA